MSPVTLSRVDRGVALEVRVQPGGRRSEVVGADAGALRIRVAVPTVSGRADHELVAFLARTFRVRPSRVLIRTGSTGRRKRIVLGGTDLDAVAERIDRLVG